MNKDHVHNMTNIVQAYCNLSRPPTNVQMTAMDFEGFECTFVTTPSSLWGKGSCSDSRGVRIPWTRGTISDAKDARVELVALSEQSEKKVGKVSRRCASSSGLLALSKLFPFPTNQTPIIYAFPLELPLCILFWAFLYYLETDAQMKAKVKMLLPSFVFSLAAKSAVQMTITQLLTTIFRAHALEALLMLSFIVYRASGNRVTVSPLTALAWALTVLPIGFPTFGKFRRLNPPVKSGKK